MYFYSPHQPQLLTTFSYNLHLALPNQWRTKKINFRSTDPPFMTYVRAEVASVFEWLRRSIRWMVRMNKNSVGPQQRVEMRVLPYGGGSLCFSLLWLDRILEPKHLLDTAWTQDERGFSKFSVDKAGGGTQKNRRGEVAINVHTSVHSGPVCGRQRGEDRRNFSEFPHLKHQKKTWLFRLFPFIYTFAFRIIDWWSDLLCAQWPPLCQNFIGGHLWTHSGTWDGVVVMKWVLQVAMLINS